MVAVLLYYACTTRTLPPILPVIWPPQSEHCSTDCKSILKRGRKCWPQRKALVPLQLYGHYNITPRKASAKSGGMLPGVMNGENSATYLLVWGALLCMHTYSVYHVRTHNFLRQPRISVSRKQPGCNTVEVRKTRYGHAVLPSPFVVEQTQHTTSALSRSTLS